MDICSEHDCTVSTVYIHTCTDDILEFCTIQRNRTCANTIVALTQYTKTDIDTTSTTVDDSKLEQLMNHNISKAQVVLLITASLLVAAMC